ncbi:DUF4365 domain-containing protein [Nonomuraea sp. NPDC001636]|uniref:DUF4365 domain-containing protein n=1 Tax=Nonomuraea sp. NPDC001636 TaxID=3154391 RepID=UPI00331738DD
MQHQIAEQAIASVRRMWALSGFAVEEVRRDYGEDLLVQTCLNGKMDASRLWVQVKGFCGSKKTTSDRTLPKAYVPKGTLLRWVRSADLVVVTLWDTATDIGWYAIPRDEFQEVDLRNIKDGDKVSISFDKDNVFDVEAAHALAWEARLTHASNLVSICRNFESEHLHHSPDAAKSADQEAVGIVLDVMADLGIIEPDISEEIRLTNETLRKVVDLFQKSLSARKDRLKDVKLLGWNDVDEAIKDAALMQVMLLTGPDGLIKRGLPYVLIDEMAELVRATFESNIRKSFREPS